MKPTFIFIGPDKTGSTWLYEVLRRHPDCYVPPVKDIYFFDRHYERGLDWYLSFFRDAPPGSRAVGELSHDYLFSTEAAARIAQDLPDVRLLTCLRDPVERTFSHYLYMVRNGRCRDSFETALVRHPKLIENSLYHKHLSVYFRLFPAGRIKVLWFHRLERDPRGFAAEAFEFLDLPFIEDVPYHARVLPASRPRNSRLARLARSGAESARRLGLVRLVGSVKRGPLARWLYRPYRDEERPRPDPETRARLLERFRPDIGRLEELLDADLSAWLRPDDRVRV